MKTIRVVAAVIRKDDRIFATQRGYGEFKDGWEFPGGKIEQGETPQQALVREIREELETEIRVGDLIDTIEYNYPTFHLSMDCFWCEIVEGSLELKEHEAAKWLDRESLYTVDWLPADVGLVEKIKNKLDENSNYVE
ncbi:MAG TPA: (deoxy)nucleoside triphosphate pyrophosphohydrolase [Candidatus Mediterraneibacter norfolkensis]|nr:(deoxy)nucleoside triphosphate pyrophosphohydrolase [Candidatus Mediterraneibacter norfolkensis]